ADVAEATSEEVVRSYWAELGEPELDQTAREFATRLASGTLANLESLDERIRSRAEHWRISRMAVVDRNILRLAVYEFLYEPTPRTVAINEALEIARRFSTYEATQFINGILDAIKRDLDEQQPQKNVQPEAEDSDTESSAPAEDGEKPCRTAKTSPTKLKSPAQNYALRPPAAPPHANNSTHSFARYTTSRQSL